MHSAFCFIILVCLGLDFCIGNPILSSRKRQAEPNCGDPAAIFYSACWSSLGISDYLDNPATGWNHTTPVCDDSTRCCVPDEAWSTCFLRLGRGLSGEDCTSMGNDNCKWNEEMSTTLAPSIYAQVRYVLKSIYGVHDFFSTYFTGES